MLKTTQKGCTIDAELRNRNQETFTDMKLAEALALRADLQKRAAQLKSRIKNAAKVQEGDQPAEDPNEMMVEFNSCLLQLEDLIVKINKTNQGTILKDGLTLTAKIAHRDILTQKVAALNDVCNYLSERADRYGRQEIKYVNTINAAKLRKQADDCSKLLRETDIEIQAANWTVDLTE